MCELTITSLCFIGVFASLMAWAIISALHDADKKNKVKEEHRLKKAYLKHLEEGKYYEKHI